uniref:Uncharacterized protein n=1 Tax=Callorhinchus milii TaxID=7868 RepID=A0A4W3GFU5_CALMI
KQDNAFPNIQSAVEGSPWSLVLPAVDWRAAGSLAGVLQAQTGVSPLYVDQETLGELRLNASLPSLLVVRLPFTSSAILMPPKEALAGNGKSIPLSPHPTSLSCGNVTGRDRLPLLAPRDAQSLHLTACPRGRALRRLEEAPGQRPGLLLLLLFYSFPRSGDRPSAQRFEV